MRKSLVFYNYLSHKVKSNGDQIPEMLIDDHVGNELKQMEDEEFEDVIERVLADEEV